LGPIPLKTGSQPADARQMPIFGQSDHPIEPSQSELHGLERAEPQEAPHFDWDPSSLPMQDPASSPLALERNDEQPAAFGPDSALSALSTLTIISDLMCPPSEAPPADEAPAPLSAATEVEASQPSPSGPSPALAPEVDETDFWSQVIATSANRASVTDTPESWRAVADAASVMLKMAETLEIVAEAKHTATAMAAAAEEAERAAKEAADLASESKQRAERMAVAAEEAEKAAQKASHQADGAREQADKAAGLVPAAEEAAKVAAQASIEANEKAEELQTALATARASNSDDAWAHVLDVAVASRRQDGERQRRRGAA